MTTLERLHAWIWTRLYAVEADLADMRGDLVQRAEYANLSRHYQSKLDRHNTLRRFA
jgi:hypothetical protein